MPIPLRIVLFVFAVGLVAFVLTSIRKSRMSIERSISWILLSVLILVLSIFPQIAYGLSDLLGVQSPVNFVFLFFIAVLLVKCFTLSRHVSELEGKLTTLVQNTAVDRLRVSDERGDDGADAPAEEPVGR